jgi:hypothetical protein
MSEQPQEPQEPAVEPEPVDPEPVEPAEDAEPDEAAESEEEPAGPQEPAEAPEDGSEEQAQMRSEKELEKAHKQIDKVREHVANRVGVILGEDAQILLPCPACGDEIPGFVWPPDAAPVPPEKIGALSAYIGLPDLNVLEDALDAIPCPDCRARGDVKTGSLVPGHTTKMCARCVGKGWIGSGSFVQPETGTTNGAQTEPAPFVPPVETALPPEAEALRRQGFLVIPPTQPVQNTLVGS